MKNSVTIIGGGIAGLTVAFRLQQAGVAITVLEKSDRLGGAIHSIAENGFLLELGPNTILETSPKVTALVTELGLDNEKLYADDQTTNRYIVRDQKPVALPASPPAFFKSPLFSWKAKLRLMQEPFISAWDNSYEESLSQFVLRRLGQEFLDYAINPFVAGVYAGDPDSLSVRHGFPKLYALEQKYGGLIKGQIKGARERKKSAETSKQSARMFSFSNGLKTLPEKIGQILGSSVKFNSTVKSIKKADPGWLVEFQDNDGAINTIVSDIVIYAGRATGLNELTLNGSRSEEFNRISEVYHPPVSIIGLGFKRQDVEHALDGFGVLIPKVEHFQILGTLFSSTLFAGRAPAGQVLLTSFIGGARQPENAVKTAAELIEMTVKDLNILLGFRGEPTYTRHIFWSQAIPQYQVGYGATKALFDQLESDYPGLFFTGNYRNGISVADTIVNGWETADRIPEALQDS